MAQNKQDDGVLTWVFLAAVCLGVMGAMVWLVASHQIVYYGTPVVDALAFPWRLLPLNWTGSIVPDLDFQYNLYRKRPHLISFMDWLGYVNVAFRPWTFLFCIVAIFLFRRQIKHVKQSRMNKRLSPNELATEMMNVFTDIAPVVCIQEKLVRNELPNWARQTFPEEFLRKAKYQKRPVLVPDPENGGEMVDRSRLEGYLQETTKYKHNGVVLQKSVHLGRQIVDIIADSKKSDGIAFPDRLSDAGKAVFAILAPYAFNATPGKAESQKVSDALNVSAYGSPTGMAKLDVPEAQETFNRWREHPLARKLAKMHPWEYTFLYALLEHAQRSGKIGTWKFIWLKPTDRVLFYALNTVGRKTPHSESSIVFSQLQFERKAARMGLLPINNEGKPIIFTKKVIESFEEEWEFWRNGEEDSEDWWMAKDAFDWENNAALTNALKDLNQAPSVPVNAE